MLHDLTLPPDERLRRAIAGYPGCLVAFSGGVDSAVVGAYASRAGPGNVLLVTIHGPAVSSDEVHRAESVARYLRAPHRLLFVDKLGDADYTGNPSNRCYFCRRLEGDALLALAHEEGYPWVLDGVHRDDLGDYRPGLKAMDERGMRHPLLEAGLGKAEVRSLARELGLPNHDTPSNSCLASRIRTGELITRETLARVEAAEELLRLEGFQRIRVRSESKTARIEVGSDEVTRLDDPPLRSRIVEGLRSLGFEEVRVDPAGYHPSGLPRTIAPRTS